MKPNRNRLVSCPTDKLLLGYSRDDLSSEQYDAVSSHLLFCDTCLEYINLLSSRNSQVIDETSHTSQHKSVPLSASLAETIERFRSREHKGPAETKAWKEFQSTDGKLRVGQIWRPKSKEIVVPSHDDDQLFSVTELDSRPHLVVITNPTSTVEELGGVKYHYIRVAPIDADIDCLKDDDFVVPEGDSPLGYSFLIQAWNEQLILIENLDCLLAEFNEMEHKMILERLTEIGESEMAEGAFSLEAVIMKGRYSDPVMRYRAREYEDTSYLRTPVESLRASLEAVPSHDNLAEYSKQHPERNFAKDKSAGESISEILRKLGVSGSMWSGGWKPYAASASEGVRQPQTFWNSNRSLTGVLEPTGKRMLLRIESNDKNWEDALVPFSWRFIAHDTSQSRGIFAILAKDDVKRGSYVAEINLGELSEIEGTVLPNNPYPIEELEVGVSDIIRESIKRARSNHELDAWRELAKREGLDPEVRAIILDSINR